jgi:hypothetical protein
MSEAPTRILICAMRTWGELGNLLAARTLAAAIEEADPDTTTEVIAGDDVVAPLAQTGGEIRSVSCGSADARERRSGYMAIMARVEAAYPSGFEAQDGWPAPLAEQIERLAAEIVSHEPDVIIGTKGILTRLCVAAARRREIAAPVVNFITNHGLLTLPIHRSTAPALHLVQYREAAEWLTGRFGVDPSRVRVAGPLVAGERLRQLLKRDGGPLEERREDRAEPREDEPQLVILSNRGGTVYTRLLDHLAAHHASVSVLFIALNDPSGMARAAEIAARARLASWLLVERLDQGEYLQRLHAAGRSRFGLLVSKAGPNTIAEALAHRLPAVVLPSGLPMEDWVPEWLERGGMGVRATSPESLIDAVDGLLRAPSRIAALKIALDRNRDQELAFDRTPLEIAGALRELVAASRSAPRRAAILRAAERFRADYERDVMTPSLEHVDRDRAGLRSAMDALPADAADPIVAEDATLMRKYYRRELRRLDRFIEFLVQERDRIDGELLRRADGPA